MSKKAATVAEGREKLCVPCGLEKPRTEFWRNALKADGLQTQCKACMYAARGKQERSKSKERICAGCQKVYRPWPGVSATGTCSIRCRDSVRKLERVQDSKARCSKCKEWKPIEEFPKTGKGTPFSWCKPCNNVEHEKRRRANGVRSIAEIMANKMTAAEKLAYKLAHNKLRRNRARAGGVGMPKVSDIKAMLVSQGGVCIYCAAPIPTGYHIDHKTPIVHGGTNEIGNLHLTCPRCNLRKGTMTHEEFMTSKKRPARQFL